MRKIPKGPEVCYYENRRPLDLSAMNEYVHFQ